MKKNAVLLTAILGLSAAVAEPLEIGTSNKSGKVWVIYSESFSRLQDGYTALIAERDTTGQATETRTYAAVMRETCASGHGSLYTRDSHRDKWNLASTVTIRSPVTIADATANVLCAVGKEQDTRFPPEKRKLTI